MAYLEYLGSVQEGKQEYFRFKDGMNMYKLPLDKAINLVSVHPSKNRNCKVSKGRISYKPNEGNNIPEKLKNNAPKKPLHDSVFIVTSLKGIGNRKYKESNDKFFDRVLQDKDFLYSKRDYILKLDKAVIIDKKLGTIKTPFGSTTYDNLSTGVKTLLNAMYIIEKLNPSEYVLNIGECGSNIFDTLFEVVKGSDLLLYISHSFSYPSKSFNLNVNGEKGSDYLALISKHLYGDVL